MSECASGILAELDRVDYPRTAISPSQILNDNYDDTLEFRFPGNRVPDDRFDGASHIFTPAVVESTNLPLTTCTMNTFAAPLCAPSP
jgi:hypothetical protein